MTLDDIATRSDFTPEEFEVLAKLVNKHGIHRIETRNNGGIIGHEVGSCGYHDLLIHAVWLLKRLDRHRKSWIDPSTEPWVQVTKFLESLEK